MSLIKAEYNGIEYELSIPDWVRFLRGKKVEVRLSAGTIWKRIDIQEKTGYTNRQCLGIDDTEVVREKKHTHPLDHPREMPLIKLRQAFLSTPLVKI